MFIHCYTNSNKCVETEADLQNGKLQTNAINFLVRWNTVWLLGLTSPVNCWWLRLIVLWIWIQTGNFLCASCFIVHMCMSYVVILSLLLFIFCMSFYPKEQLMFWIKQLTTLFVTFELLLRYCYDWDLTVIYWNKEMVEDAQRILSWCRW